MWRHGIVTPHMKKAGMDEMALSNYRFVLFSIYISTNAQVTSSFGRDQQQYADDMQAMPGQL